MIAFAREGRGTCKPLVGFDRPLGRSWLNEQQQRAVRHLWQSPDRVMLLRGAAGTGKTTLLQEAVEGIEAAGHRVVALAPSAEASRGVLREAGFQDADTVARFLQDPRLQEQARFGVLLIDEASLLGARTLSRVFHLAQKLDSRVILVGDVQQHGSVERGAAFRLLQERAAVPVVEVTDIRRQKGRYRAAVRLLSEGKVAEGFTLLDRLGWVEELPAAQRERRLAAAYLAAVSAPKRGGEPRTALVVSPTHAEGARVTAAIRGALQAAGKLGEERGRLPSGRRRD
ncbi:MAG TPA: AAA family ATPase [Gemmataceae bacterium]|nr:AAA family ATPase [Gemmataceae bacterium]